MTDSDEVKLLPCEPLLESVKASLEDVFYDTLNCGFDADLLARAAIEAYEATRPPVVTDEVVERVKKRLAVLDQDPRASAWVADFREVLAAALASMPAVVSGGQSDVTITRELYAFLMGEGPLEGVWFGDLNEGLKGAFWWRALLRCAAGWPEPPAQPEVGQ